MDLYGWLETFDTLPADRDLDNLSRAAACNALGVLADDDHVPWRAQLEAGANDLAQVADLEILLDR